MRSVVVLCNPDCAVEMIRSGDIECDECGQLYSRHGYCAASQLSSSMSASQFPEYFIHVTCDGRHVKL